MTLPEFVALFPDAKVGSGGFIARCPAHDDSTPSLSISAGDKGVLVYCHAGCSPEEICAAKGIKEADLFYDVKQARNGSDDFSHPIEEYEYFSEHGKKLYRVTRHLIDGKKTFRQWRYDPTSPTGWRAGLKDKQTGKMLVELVPYRLPNIIEAVSLDHPIYIAEGEKDVNALVKHGLDATCNTGGAGKWREAYNRYFKGAHVVVIADKDDPGRAHARSVCCHLQPVAASVRYVELPGDKVKDAYDYFAAGGTNQSLRELVAATPLFDPKDTTPEAPDTESPEVIYPPLRWANESIEDPRPLREPIVHGMFRRRDMFVLSGPSKAHKSWQTLALAVSVVTGRAFMGHRCEPCKVLYVNLEIDSSDFDARLIIICNAMGVDVEMVRGKLAVLNLRGCNSTHSVLLPELAKIQKEHSFGLIVIDPSYLLYDELVEENSNSDIAKFLRGVTKFSEEFNFAIVFCAHFAKGNAAAKNMVDRTAGASTWARYPDCLMSVVAMDEQGKEFTIEFVLRAHPKIPPKSAVWEYPLMVVDENVTTEETISRLRDRSKNTGPNGARRKLTVEDYVKALPKVMGHDVTKPRGMVFSGAQEREAIMRLGYHSSTIRQARELAIEQGKVKVVYSTLAGRTMYVGEPDAIDLWTPHMLAQDAAERTERLKAKAMATPA